MPRALLSVSDKTGVIELARDLAARGFELVSTGGTAAALAGAGLPVVGVADVTGFPEMMDGRVKTLHPLIHAGILARRNQPADLESLARHGIRPIDLVVVNLYPFAQTSAKTGIAFDDLVEQIDIGGPSLVRAAAKNFRDVLVVVEPSDYPRVLMALDEGPSLAFRFELMKKAFGHTAEYDATIAATLSRVRLEGGAAPRSSRPAKIRRRASPCPSHTSRRRTRSATSATARIRIRSRRGTRRAAARSTLHRLGSARPPSFRGKSFRTRIFSISMQPPESCSSSASRRRR